MRTLLLLLLASSVADAATCYAVTSGNWNTAAIWASTSGGAGGSCAATGGSGVTIMGQTATLAAGVPGVAAGTDRVIINTGVAVHVTSGVGVELGEASYTSPQDAITINATDQNTYGELDVDKGGLVVLHGASSSGDNFFTINRYGKFHVEPNGSLWVGNASNGPNGNIGGRFYVGCGDQTSYPVPGSTCAGNDGAWVTASIGATLNITAVGSLPAGIATGDLVELTRAQTASSISYPYQTNDYLTTPPTPPVMPITSDTGTAAANICGSASTCPIPDGVLLCVVQVSGTSISIGWPHGGTPAQPYCTGAETAAAITNAGSGKLWLTKPAFVWGDPRLVTWNNAHSLSGSFYAGGTHFDALRSGAVISYAPISNAAGTGPGRIGDNSLSLSANNWGAVNGLQDQCSFRKVEDVTSSGCYINYDNGAIMIYGFGVNASATGSYTAAASTVPVFTGGFVPTAAQTYSEFVVANSDIRYLSGTQGFFQFAVLNNSSNEHMAFTGNATHEAGGEVGIGSYNASAGYTGTAATPLQINGNAFYQSLNGSNVLTAYTSSYADVSLNYDGNWRGMLGCQLNNIPAPASSVFTNLTITQNNATADGWLSGNNSYCIVSGSLIWNNRVTGFGVGDSFANGSPGYTFGQNDFYNNNAALPNVYQSNIYYGMYRTTVLGGNTRHTHEALLNNWHHVVVMEPQGSQTQNGGYLGNAEFDNNLIASYDQSSQTLDGFDSGFNSAEWIDNMKVWNNTWAGMHGTCYNPTDTDASFSINTGLMFYSNICAGSTNGSITGKIQFSGTPAWLSLQSLLMANNTTQGTEAPYTSLSTNPNNIPAPTWNRSVNATHSSGVPYNVDLTRNVTGVALENPSYTTAITTGALQFTRTSSTNMTLAWSADGVSYGTAQQLNWGGSGVSYTVSSASYPTLATDALTVVTVTTTTSPFTASTLSSGVAVPAGAPIGRWAVMLTGADSGKVFAIVLVPAVNQLNFVGSNVSGIAGGDTFAVLQSDLLLADASTGTVEVGIDPRYLPGASATDTGITLGFADYCSTSTKCGSAAVVSGLPSTMVPGTTNLPLMPDNALIPSAGGSAQQVLCNGSSTCGGVAYFQSSGSSWATSGLYGGWVGAVSPNPAPSLNQTFVR